jgi:putative spermidine/putrescine transport system ATP-binding protein
MTAKANETGNAAGVYASAAAASGSPEGTPVSLRNLTRAFGATKALDGMSLDIAPGELVALLGPSGCGKTTALRIVAGFEYADSGEVLVNGRDVSEVPAARRDMGMVFQSYSLFPNMSALDNVGFGLRMRKTAPAQRRRKAAELLDMVGLSAQAGQYPHQLSGGQQQRVALARALAIEPHVLLLDEPLSALDAKVRLQLREQIRTLQQRLGTTTIFVTHDQEEALSMADRVGVMRDGRLEQVADPSELYSRPATAFVAEFVGTMNRLPGELAGPGTVTVLGVSCAVIGNGGAGSPAIGHGGHGGAGSPAIGHGGHGGAGSPPIEDGLTSGPVDVLVRPEGLTVAAAEGGNGIVSGRTFLGAITRVAVLLSGDTEVRVDLASAAALAIPPGTSVQVGLPPTPVLVARSDTGFPGGLAAAQLPVPGLPGPGDRSAAAEDNRYPERPRRDCHRAA